MIEGILTIWEAVIGFFTDNFPSIQNMFWNDAGSGQGSLTILGILCVINVAVGVFFLIMGVIQNFLHLRT